jgi:hypothetical protein
MVDEGCNNSTITRAQSSLELLSQTAAVVEESDEKSCMTLTPPYSSARITPADSVMLMEGSPVKKQLLSIPDVGSWAGGPVFLEQKRSFLPPAVSVTSTKSSTGGTLDGSNHSGDYHPGLFLTYSNVSLGSTGMAGSASSAPNAASRTTSGPNGTIMANHQASTAHYQHHNLSSHGTEATATNFSGNHHQHQMTLHHHHHGNGAVTTHSQAAPIVNVGSGGSSGSSEVPNFFPSASFSSSHRSHSPFHHHATSFVPPRPGLRPSESLLLFESVHQDSSSAVSDDPVRDNYYLRAQMAQRDATIDALQAQVESLQQEIQQLRSLPTGKISQIPVE